LFDFNQEKLDVLCVVDKDCGAIELAMKGNARDDGQ
jgi:hypothetical protein